MRKELQIGERLQVVLSEDWTEWFQSHWNWKDFTLVKVAYEDEVCMGSRELDLALLGFGVWIQWIYNREAPTRVECIRRMDEWMAQNAEKEQTDTSGAVHE